MAIKFIKGSTKPVVTGRTVNNGDSPSCTIYVEGAVSAIKNAAAADYVPAKYELKSSYITTNGDGTARLSVNCNYTGDDTDDSESNVIRTTYTITMSEVQTELKNHPGITPEGRKEVVQWLATEPGSRYLKSGGASCYVDSSGNQCTVSEDTAKKFIAAYEAGIESYNRYFPIVRKISYCKKCPGLNEKGGDGESVEGGSVAFSVAGTFSAPDISISGYEDSGWFKSGDEWQQSDSRIWTHTEEWTWTPEGSGSQHSWIYGGNS